MRAKRAAPRFMGAIMCFEMSLERDPDDLITKACLGETCCLQGETERGLQLLREMLDAGGDAPELQEYTARARVIVAGS